MNIHQKIKALRLFNDFTQEEMAEKLGYASVQGYAKIERGESDLTIGKLEEIAKVLGVNLQNLISLKSKNAISMAENCLDINYCTRKVSCLTVLTESECLHELEKMRILLQEKQIQIEHLQFEVSLLKKLAKLSEQDS